MVFSEKQKFLAFILILVLAVILRSAYFFVFRPPLNWDYGVTFHLAAKNILSGKGYSLDGIKPYTAREPGYSLFFLAPFYAVFGPHIFAALILNLLLTLLIICFVFWFGKNYFSTETGLWAGFFLALYPPLIAFGGELLADLPFAFLVVCSVFILIQAVEKKSKKRIFAAGVFFGAATLTKSSATFLPFFLLPFLYLSLSKNWKETIRAVILLYSGFLLTVVPYFAANYLTFGRFFYLRDDGGLNLWAGSYLPWDGEFRGNNAYPLPDLVKGLDVWEADAKLAKLAFENIKKNSLGVLLIWLKKPARLLFKPEFNSVLQRENSFAHLTAKGKLNPVLIRAVLLAINVLLVGLAALGAFVSLQKNRRMAILILSIIVYFLLILLPFSPDARYKLPLLPFLAVLASLGLSFLKNLIMRRF